MDHIFNKQLQKFVLVFFDDILIYTRSWEEHLQHLDEVLSIMEAHSLFAKESKCEFGLTEILYLGHVIGANGVKVNQEKIQAIIDQPPPRNASNLRGFLGLCLYSGGLSRDSLSLHLLSQTLYERVLLVGQTMHKVHLIGSRRYEHLSCASSTQFLSAVCVRM